MSKDVLQDCAKDTADWFGNFSKIYLSTFVNKKLENIYDDAVDKVIPEALQEDGDDEEEENDDEKGGDNENNEENNDENAENAENNEENVENNEKETENENETKDDEKKNEDDNGDDNNDDIVEEKELGDKEDIKPIVSGATAIKYNMGIGPDKVEHFYCHVACFSIKPKDSVISKSVIRHSITDQFKKTLEKKYPIAKKIDMGDIKWPKKKLMGNKNAAFYKQRFNGIRIWLDCITSINELSNSDEFLLYFKLKYDENSEFLSEIFQETIEELCDINNINYDKIENKSSKLGIDVDEVEMLKFVAVESIGVKHINTMKGLVESNKIIPQKLKKNGIKRAEGSVAKVIGTGIETGWKGFEPTFKKITESMNTVIDKAAEPLNNVLSKALDPVGKVIKDAFSKADGKISVKIGKNKLDYTRFDNITEFINTLNKENESYTNAIKKLLNTILKMKNIENYACYLTISNFKKYENITKMISFIDELQENHYRLAIALTDMIYVLSRGFIRCFIPLMEYIDKCSKEFDEKNWKQGLDDAVRNGAKKLTIDYFSLNNTLRRTCRGVGKKNINIVLKLARVTTIKIADLLGSIAYKFNPKKKENIKKDFTSIAIPLLNKFLDDRANAIIKILRVTLQNMIANKLLTLTKDKLNDVISTLDELVKELPEPISDNLKPSNIIYYLIEKGVNNITILAVKLLINDVIKNVYNKDSNVEPLNKKDVNKYRSKPVIRENDYDDNEEVDDDNEDDQKEEPGNDGDADADAGDGGDDAGDN